MTRRIFDCVGICGRVPHAIGALAHHNMTAIFDFNDRVTLTGTLTKVDWRNPHIYLTVDVKNAGGATESWQAEGPSPTWFRIRDSRQGRFREQHRQEPQRRAQSRARQIADRPDPDDHVAGRPRPVGLSTELLTVLRV